MKDLKESVKFLQKQYKTEPKVGIVLGSGLGNFIDEIEVEKEVATLPVQHQEVKKG